MATLSQHYDTNFNVNPYYEPINKQLSPMYDKSKKTWSQRLKISKSEKATTQMVVPQLPPQQLHPQQLQLNEFTGGLEFAPSALSRSMKYAEPWIYGTVRGVPARPMHFHPGQAMFAPMHSDIAVVICSCPEYLNGTKREVKKASVCKKCKGSRLPLAQFGGTVRIRPTSAPLQQKQRPTTAATLRVVSSKSRPSILDPQRDPYDLMRRTRLLSPEPKPLPQQQDKNYRSSRSKNQSPNRSRSRTPRSQLEESAKSSPKQTSSCKTDRWIVEDTNQPENDSNHRRSILRCNVNPYDLISKKSSPSSSSFTQHLSEFSPNHHDDDDDDDDVVAEIFGAATTKAINQKVAAISRKTTGPGSTSSPSPSTASSSATTGSSSSMPHSGRSSGSSSNKAMNYANVKAIAGQRISLGESTASSSLITRNGDSFTYENVTPVSLDSETATSDSPKASKQQHSAKKDESKTKVASTSPSLSSIEPKRPPRRRSDTNPSHGSTDDDNNGIVAATSSSQQHHQTSSQISSDSVVGAASQRPSIKSILKRPLSSPAPDTLLAATTPSKSSLNGDTDTGSLVGSTTDSCRFEQQQQHHHHHQIKRNSARIHESPLKGAPARSSGVGRSADTVLAKSNGTQKTTAETKTGSQFYIPLPQARKKVQFMVEDKIIQADNVDDDNDVSGEDDDEDDYHSAQGDDDDKTEIPKQIGKTLTANYQNCYVATRGSNTADGGGSSKTDTRKLSSKPTLLVAGDMDEGNDDYNDMDRRRNSDSTATLNGSAGGGDVIENPKNNNSSSGAMANRFNQELLHRPRQHQHQLQQQQQQQHQQQQEAVLNLLQQESNLVSSELLNSGKNSYYQNLLHHPRHQNSQEQDEPHYEDVADDEDNNDGVGESTVLHHDEDPCDRVNGTRTKDSPTANLKMTSTKPGEATTTTPSAEAVSRNAIRRTHSERHPCNVNIGTSSNSVILNFKDTMALRMKVTRKDSRDIFASSSVTTTQQSVGLFRPKEPPPPPPTFGSAGMMQQQRCLSNTRTAVPTKETAPASVVADGSSKTQTVPITATKDEDNKSSNDYDSVDDGTEDDHDDSSIGRQKQLSSRNSQLSVSNSRLEEQKQPPFMRDDANRRRRSTTNSTSVSDSVRKDFSHDRKATNIYETYQNISSTVVEAAIPPTPAPAFSFGNAAHPNRTVVRVAPFNKTTSEIHRLKITHTDDDNKALGARNSTNGTNSQKKTSILINGDDCYSTVNVTNDTPLYQSSVVVADGSSIDPMLKVTSNTVTINVVSSSPRTPEEELIYKNNKINTMLSRGATRAIIPIGCSGGGGILNASPLDPVKTSPKRGRTLITLDYDKSPSPLSSSCSTPKDELPPSPAGDSGGSDEVFSHEAELVKILRNPVEAVRRNLVPHICGKAESANSTDHTPSVDTESKSSKRVRKRHKSNELTVPSISVNGNERNSFVGKLLEDPTLSHLADGLENEVVVKLIENSLKRLKDSRTSIDTSGTKDNEDMNRLINISLQRVKEERQKLETSSQKTSQVNDAEDIQSNRGSISSGNSFSSANYEMFDFSDNNESDCYQSCSSEIATDIDTPLATRSKFYQMLVDATLAEIEISTNTEEDHHYESIRGIGGHNVDPIYEEITDIPPPLPLSPPPLNDPELEKKAARSMFEGASKYDILSYLVDAKERGLVREESFEYNINNTSNPIIIEEENDTLSDLKQISDMSSRISHLSVTSDSSEDNTSLTGSMINDRLSVISALRKGTASDIERNDSGVGSETSKSSRSKYQNSPQSGSVFSKISPIHLCEDCDGPVETQVTDSGVMFAPLVCRKCGKKRAERKEIITEIVETEEKYGRDLQIILEEFCQPMLVAGLLTQEQLSAIFLNTEELLENNQTLAERMRDGLDIALEQGDDDLLTVNIGKIFLDFTQMLHAFESYCVRQAGASLLLANLEKEKELLRIFLKVSQMENTVLRRMNLNSFLMVPVQRVTKYPLLLARLYKVTPPHLEGRDLLKQAQEKIELHLNHINQEAKDVPTKLWRRISSSSPNRRASCEIDMINIKLRKMAIDILEWNHDEVRFAMEGRLMYTQPTDSNWKKGRTIKLNPVNALLVTNGKPSANYKAEKAMSDQLNFPKHTGIREASLLVVKEKCGRYTLIREPLYLDRCIVCTEADWDEYFELQEISSKDTFIFKAEDGVRTKQWYTQLQYHAQGMGAWRKRRNALANIMINGMLSRT